MCDMCAVRCLVEVAVQDGRVTWCGPGDRADTHLRPLRDCACPDKSGDAAHASCLQQVNRSHQRSLVHFLQFRFTTLLPQQTDFLQACVGWISCGQKSREHPLVQQALRASAHL
ncbi:MAG: hypothetical protein EHM80_15415 [Nitrospiraceae bacterium]|nr:MAG: hypothetical protein EHM80_17650 [Nitrospiraceae bacterium]RPH76069.1 MAG: hypothetical protein EHM80_15415 [Nitrospiraceae bacterium]